MDYTASTLNSLGDMSSVMKPMYPAFAAPTPVHLRTLNSVTNCVPSPLHGLDFPSITSPTGSYSFYGRYTPAQSPTVSLQYDTGYLHRLKSNPMFLDLQSVLRQECSQMKVPANLITTSWNLMQLPQMAPAAPLGSGHEVYHQHMQLQDKLLQVRIDPAISADGLSVENDYSTQVGHTEMGRYRALHSCPDDTVKTTMNSYYDKERLELIKSTEEKLDKLIKKSEDIRTAIHKVNNQKTIPYPVTNEVNEPPLQGASLLLQPADKDSAKFTAVRKLKFNESEENVNVEDDDYLNCSVNSEDFEIDEIDVETVDTKSDNGDNKAEDVPANEQSEQNLLKLCIIQSGIEPDNEHDSQTTENNSTYNACSVDISARTDAAVDSDIRQVMPDSTADSPNSVHSSDSGCDVQNSTGNLSFERNGFDRYNQPMMQTFSTPVTNYGQMIPPQNINFALSQMAKMCGGRSVSFTPELRRDFTAKYTPEFPKFSPLTNICDNTKLGALVMNDSGLHNVSSTSVNGGPESNKHAVTDTTPANHSAISQDSNNDNIDTTSFKSHRILTADSTSIMSNWYHAHVHYPYPSEEEANELATLTGITTRQVKKWMANKRVRCYNTLSITGNQHPIKHKYRGGQKRKTTMDKENSDSTTNTKPNYTVMNDTARQVLNQWYEQNINNPYPTEAEKQRLAELCDISVNQVKSWFANKRNRANNTRRQVPNYFIKKHPEYSYMVEMVGHKREEARNIKRRKLDQYMYIQPPFYI